ncbi:hypothetical protein PLICRDRAFT_243433 [Plicaturopsis crispa FD-325 SS-3]|nr:hypothetical protein PLICRDRAFT_243433 [Plicaturopsis crispa FD-325 SS-3]
MLADLIGCTWRGLSQTLAPDLMKSGKMVQRRCCVLCMLRCLSLSAGASLLPSQRVHSTSPLHTPVTCHQIVESVQRLCVDGSDLVDMARGCSGWCCAFGANTYIHRIWVQYITLLSTLYTRHCVHRRISTKRRITARFPPDLGRCTLLVIDVVCSLTVRPCRTLCEES